MRDNETKALQTQLVILEAALACIQTECDLALEVPEVSFATICRVSAIARQSSLPHELAKTASSLSHYEAAPACELTV